MKARWNPKSAPRQSGIASAGLLRRKDLAIDIIASEIRSAEREIWLEASRLVLTTGEPAEIARKMRERAERAIKPE